MTLHMRLGRPDDAREIGVLMRRVVRRWVLPEQPCDAGTALLARLGARSIRARIAAGHRFHLGFLDGVLVGVAAIRDDCHLMHFFVSTRYQRRGIARRLWQRAMRDAVRRADTRCFTLNATRVAIPVYLRLGFVATGAERPSPNGVISTPMMLQRVLPATPRKRA